MNDFVAMLFVFMGFCMVGVIGAIVKGLMQIFG